MKSDTLKIIRIRLDIEESQQKLKNKAEEKGESAIKTWGNFQIELKEKVWERPNNEVLKMARQAYCDNKKNKAALEIWDVCALEEAVSATTATQAKKAYKESLRGSAAASLARNKYYEFFSREVEADYQKALAEKNLLSKPIFIVWNMIKGRPTPPPL